MTKAFHSILILATAAALVSCGKDESSPAGGPGKTAAVISLPSAGPLSIRMWAAADTVRINGEPFALAEGAGGASARFEGVVPADKYFSLGFPSSVSNEEDYLSFAFDGQVQEGNGSAAHLPVTVLMEDIQDYSDVTLSSLWADGNAALFRCNGVICFRLTLPSDIGTPRRIILDGNGAMFPLDNGGTALTPSYTLDLKDVSLQGGALTAYLAVPEKAFALSAYNPATVTVAGDKTYSAPVTGYLDAGGDILTVIDIDSPSDWAPGSAVDGEGTEESPYILHSAEDLVSIHDLLVAGKTVWFELDRDVDMQGINDWMPLNIGNLDLEIHFDGKGHTISNFSCKDMKYTSFFGALVGTVCNVTFDHPYCRHSSTQGSYALGIIGGYAGTTAGRTAEVYNVHVTDGYITSPAKPSSAFHMGGFFGVAVNSSIRNCSFDGTVQNDVYGTNSDADKNQSYTGGIAGLVGKACEIRGCSVSGSINSKSQYTGGIAGCVDAAMTIERCSSTADIQGARRYVGGIAGGMKASISSIVNCWSGGSVSCSGDQDTGGILGSMMPWQTVSCCYSTAVITAMRVAGGIVGHACESGWTNTAPANNTVEKCIAWNPSIKAMEAGDVDNKGSSGCIVGFTSMYNTLTGCWRRADIDFTSSDPAATVPVDQPDCSPETPFVKGTTPGITGKYGSPYHGKASSLTVSAIAAQLGWDTAVWDLGSDLPKLKENE